MPIVELLYFFLHHLNQPEQLPFHISAPDSDLLGFPRQTSKDKRSAHLQTKKKKKYFSSHDGIIYKNKELFNEMLMPKYGEHFGSLTDQFLALYWTPGDSSFHLCDSSFYLICVYWIQQAWHRIKVNPSIKNLLVNFQVQSTRPHQ